MKKWRAKEEHETSGDGINGRKNEMKMGSKNGGSGGNIARKARRGGNQAKKAKNIVSVNRAKMKIVDRRKQNNGGEAWREWR
jgi:hypothetical protein